MIGENQTALHFGVLSFKGAGHLNPLIALSPGTDGSRTQGDVFSEA